MTQEVKWRGLVGFVIVGATLLRLWLLGSYPPGLYHDEAFNGLDALGVLDGNWQVWFGGNNGREPLHIYAIALSIQLFGLETWAVRLPSALVGGLGTWAVYLLGQAWFGKRVGLFGAIVWGMTLWPLHLSLVGFRAIFLPPLLALTAWLITEAFKRTQVGWWFMAGLVYGLSWYSYLAVRFTPLLLGILGLIWLGKKVKDKKERGLSTLLQPSLYFGVGFLLVLAPLLWASWQDPTILLGRTGQVSVLNEQVNGGDLWGTLWQQGWQAVGMFVWQGDDILRHNPAGRPVFDGVMVMAFAVGLLYCLKQSWQGRMGETAVLLWTLIMLGPTILAEDTPHFLRAVGVLPAVLFIPALGLEQIWQAVERRWKRPLLAPILITGMIVASLAFTLTDYVNYGQDTDTGYLFEAGTVALAEDARMSEIPVLLDDRFWQGWEAVPFLLHEIDVYRFTGEIKCENGLTAEGAEMGVCAVPEKVVYVWPYESLEFLSELTTPNTLVKIEEGAWGRNDLEPTAYPLYVKYSFLTAPNWPIQSSFGNGWQSHQADISQEGGEIIVDLYWSVEGIPSGSKVFVHHIGADGTLVGQSDGEVANGRWSWWQNGVMVQDRHMIAGALSEGSRLLVGMYDPITGERFLRPDGSDSWQIVP